MSEDNQIWVPPSFIALYSDARNRLTATSDLIRSRYELCEDLAGHLVDHAQTLYHVEAPSEAGILERMHAGLTTPESGFNPAEARWIIYRLAEILSWRCPDLP
jgi:hypothetical protein